MNKVLIIDDDKELCALIKRSVLSEDIEADFCNTGKEGLQKLKEREYQLVILDIMMPGMDGFETLEEIRKENSLPILMFTSKNDSASKVRGLRAGADDYLTKPFYMEELVARVYAILRTNGKIKERNGLEFKSLYLDTLEKRVYIEKEEIKLQNKQFNMLEYFVLNTGSILLKEQIYDRIWGIDSDATIEIVEVYVSNLRKKLSKYGYDKYRKDY